MATKSDYTIRDANLNDIRNRNEKRVIKAMKDAVSNRTNFCGCRLCIEDVYAASMNDLPAHYVQAGAIVLRSRPQSEDDVRRIVDAALAKVIAKPNHTAESAQG